MRRDTESGAVLSQRRGVPQPKLSQMSHPLLGDRPTLQLLPSRTDIAGEMTAPPPIQPSSGWPSVRCRTFTSDWLMRPAILLEPWM